MTQHLYVVRHGETPWNREGRWQGHTDIALNDVGRAQAAELAERLLGLGLSRATASDLSRASETAQIVADRLGIGEITRDHRLRERGFGVFEGLTQAECAARYPEVWAGYLGGTAEGPPGSEGRDAVIVRMRAAALDAAQGLPSGDSALVVSHGGAIRLLVGSIVGEVPPPLGNGATFRLSVDSGTFTGVERLC